MLPELDRFSLQWSDLLSRLVICGLWSHEEYLQLLI